MYAAIDVGATKIKIVIFSDLKLNSLIDEFEFKTLNDFDEDLRNIIGTLKDIEIKSIGICVPGFIVDKNKGVVSAANIANWESKDLKSALKSITNSENIFILHDGEAHAKSELVWSELNEDFLYIAWGTGIGATYIRNVGSEVLAQQIEFGYQRIKSQFLEELVGGGSLEKRFGKKVKELNAKDWEDVTTDFAEGLSNVIALNYPKKIVWGGGVAFKQPHLIEQIMSKSHKFYPFWPTPKYEFGKFENNGGVYGALAEIKIKLKSI